MNLSLNKGQTLSAIFIAVSVSSAVYISVAAVNYLDFFPALAQLSSQVTSVGFVNASTGPSLSARVDVNNPSDYSGFKLADLSLKLYFGHSNASTTQTLFQDNPLFGLAVPNSDLGPRSSLVSFLNITLNSQQLASLSDFNRTYYGQISAHVVLTVDIRTFLDPVIGVTVLNIAQDLSLSS